MRLIPFSILFFFLLFGCASHPIINPHLPKAGKSKKGYALSIENVAPVMWYRIGISDKSELGLRIGYLFMAQVWITVELYIIKKKVLYYQFLVLYLIIKNEYLTETLQLNK